MDARNETMQRPPVVAICGSSTSNAREDSIAKTVGQLCAQRGAVVLCGGLGGVMTSAACGARNGGGVAIGLLPGDDAEEGNEYLSYALPTGLGEMRNGLLASMSAGMIAIGGGFGTLSEIALMRRLSKPVTCLSSWNIAWPHDDVRDPSIHWAEDAGDAVEWLWKAMSR